MTSVLRQRPLTGEFRLALVRGDLTATEADVLVNAANEQLQHAGGLAAALVGAGGEEIQRESDEWVTRHGPVATGFCAVTGAGKLPARLVVHAVGPVWRGGDQGEEDLLRSAVHEALLVARGHRAESVALPAISAGVFGFPARGSARIMLDQIARFAAVHELGGPSDIRVVLRDEPVIEAFVEAWDERWGA